MPPACELSDRFGRRHDNLRVSVTDRCNVRCFFCMPAQDVAFLPREQILSFEEIERFVRIAARLGIRKLRLTGGEPLVRRGLPDLVRRLAAVPGIEDLALTTNGVLLEELAEPLFQAGLRRINIHLDTLDRGRFLQITRRDLLDRVLAGIAACRRLGYRPIKINAVAVRGVTEADIAPLARFGREQDLQVRFIEYMPLDGQNLWERRRVLFAEEILAVIEREIGPLVPVPEQDPRSPASEYRYADGRGGVAVIASISRPFCLSCNRIRLTADGHLRYCLFALEETDLKPLLRGGASEEEIAQAVRTTVLAKWEGHAVNTARFVAPPRPMYAIGG